MGIAIRPIQPRFVAEISGIDISRPLDRETTMTIEAAIEDNGVIVFRDQSLSDDQQIAFARLLGEPERYVLSYRKGIKLRLGSPEMVDVSNLDADTGRPQHGETRHRMINLGNRLWHSDSSFRLPCGGLSMLFAHAVPPSGGETEFADTRAAFDALPEESRGKLVTLSAEHSLMHSRATLGFTDFSPEERSALPPVRQPLVRSFGRAGRKALYLGAHASHIVGMPVPEGRMMLLELLEHATQRQFVYRHTWRVGDMVLWNNRCTLHRGMPFDETHARELRRVTTNDETAARPLAA
ncbi:MAG: TauD/TfdA family dioxygenase [Hyphomicrobiaceae bacterium]|nr:TauD/TfdA family dioxygenase [Hyphomicrobiaceae bacterium]